ncbi:MAG: sulfatase-like hydrolase/transferase [Phycisphaerales bacterium]
MVFMPAILIATLASIVVPPEVPGPSATKDAPAPAATDARPNFVFILAEATGWSSTSVDLDGRPPSHARPSGLTPNLEQLAADGLRFSDFYVTSPRCTPSRASFVTGLSPSKLRMTYQSEGNARRSTPGEGNRYSMMRLIPPESASELPPGVRTTGEVLREIGYGTAHFGKWHAGRADPRSHGFDASDGPNSNQGPERGVAPNPSQCREIVDRGIAFMQACVKEGKPFFVQISHYGFGGEDEATPESLEVAKRLVPGIEGKPLGAIAGQHDLDLQLARVRAALDELGVAENTFILFSSDHGAQGGGGGRAGRSANPPFGGGKGSVSEGGIRVPFIVAGPGVPAGAVSTVRATSLDLLPTLRDLAGAPLPMPEDPDAATSLDGGSLAAILRSSGEQAGEGVVRRPREAIVIHFPHYDLGNGGPASAIYLGAFKLVRSDETQTIRLHEIAKDPAEANDLAAAMPEKVAELVAMLDAHLLAIGAPRAKPNPEFEATSAAGEAASGRSGDARRGGGQRRGERTDDAGGGRRRQDAPRPRSTEEDS